MKQPIYSLLRQFAFWMLFFAFLRAIYLVYNIPMLRADDIGFGESMASFWHALYLDMAAACYLLILPLFILTIQSFHPARWLDWINRGYALLVIFLYSFVNTVEVAAYSEWKTKLSAKTLAYGHHPQEAVESISAGQFLGLLAILILSVAIAFYSYNKVFYRGIKSRPRSLIIPPVFFALSLPVLVIGLRGGVGEIPITQSVSYYSEHSLLNWASVNSGFNLTVSLMESSKFDNENPFRFYEQAEAEASVAELHRLENDTTVSILKNRRPNIIIIIIESWSADLIESLGGEPGITPEFARLEEEGILFTNFYSTGNRSQQAMASIFGGFPALPYTTITENPTKSGKLPKLAKIFNEQGYRTSFYFGGELMYGNIKAYILSNGFQKIVEQDDIDPGIPRGRLGVHDEFLLSLQGEEMRKEKEPFLSAIFTLSSHSPYDQPMEQVLDWGGNERPFINSAFYTDRSLGQYFRQVKSEPWYPNTLFILLADHSHNTYRNWPLESFEYHKVPLLLCGDVIRDEWKGTKIGKVSSNVDLTATILNQLGWPASEFKWSKDLFNPGYKEFAFFEINDGVGFKNSDGEFVYNVRLDDYHVMKMHPGKGEVEKENLIRQGKSYIQVLFQEFMDM